MLTGFRRRRRILCVQGAGVSVVRSLLTVIHALTHFVWDRTLRYHVEFVNVAVGVVRVAEWVAVGALYWRHHKGRKGESPIPGTSPDAAIAGVTFLSFAASFERSAVQHRCSQAKSREYRSLMTSVPLAADWQASPASIASKRQAAARPTLDGGEQCFPVIT